MNILYFVNYFPPSTGAAALNSLKISEHLAKFGHKLLILAPGDMGKTLTLKSLEDPTYNQNINVLTSNSLIKPPFSWIFSHYENYVKFLLKLRSAFIPDLILSQYHAFHYASVVGNYLSKKLDVPHIVRSHDIFIDLKSHSIPYRIFNLLSYPQIYRSISRCRDFYVVSSELKDYLIKVKKLRNVNIRVHHNGIDTNLFYPTKNQEVLKNKYGCETIISFIGLITQDIGLYNLIKILPKVLKIHKDTHLIIIGEGSHKDYILKIVKKLKINNQVHFLGVKPHNEIPFYINNCDIGIGRITLKKIWTYAVPIKCLEYMACKKPFISTPLSRDIIKNNDVGLVLNRNFSQKELLDKILTLIEDQNLRKKLGENGIKKINSEFKWEVIMDEFNKKLVNK